ncbi:MAG: TrmH family RNA methyltransferase [Bacteroidota bacterium]
MEDLIDFLSRFVTKKRLQLFDNVLQHRTRYISIVLEDIYQPHNASAVLRTADCFGIQDVHIIENRNKYNVNPDVALGSYKWINIIKHNEASNNTIEAITRLKKNGYRIVATSPAKNNVILDDFNLNQGKAAIFFGTELTGLSEQVLEMADDFIKIPMYGFTESFNISVSAAIILHYLTGKLRKTSIEWQLSQEEKLEVKLKWLKNSIKNSEMLIKKYNEEKNKN